MVSPGKTEPNGLPNVNPDDVAIYLHAKLAKSATKQELLTAKKIADLIEADPEVRAFVEELERLMDPTMHPERHPSEN